MGNIEIAVWKNLTLNAQGEQGKFEARSAKFDVVNFNDQMWLQGCCDKTISERPRVAVSWQHDINSVIGFADMSTSKDYLICKGEINLNIQKGKDAWELMKQGVMNEWSPGFYVIQEKIVQAKNNNNVRGLVEVKIAEVALLPIGFAANPNAQTRMLNSLRVSEINNPDAGPQLHPVIVSEPQTHSDKAAMADILAGIKTLTNNLREVNRNGRQF